MDSTWDKVYDTLKLEFGQPPTNQEVQSRLLEARKFCTLCMFEKPLDEFEGEFCRECRAEAKAAGIEI